MSGFKFNSQKLKNQPTDLTTTYKFIILITLNLGCAGVGSLSSLFDKRRGEQNNEEKG